MYAKYIRGLCERVTEVLPDQVTTYAIAAHPIPIVARQSNKTRIDTPRGRPSGWVGS